MESTRVLQLWIFACFASAVPARGESHLIVTPESPVLEMGTNFTATCLIINTNEITADDLYWNMSKITISKELYTKINRTALSVTIPITSEKQEWLYCLCKKESAYVVFNQGKFIHGIWLRKGYRPVKPENLSCVAHQEGGNISPTITCGWKTVGHQTPEVPTIYTLNVVTSTEVHNHSTHENEAQITMNLFPFHMPLEVWVEASNELGKIESEHLNEYAGCFVKPNPPSNVRLISEESFSTSLLINWTQDIAKVYLKFQYRIRYCQNGSQSWNYVPLSDTDRDMESFRLQMLQPNTVYVTQVSRKSMKEPCGYWSDWSTNSSLRTPEDEPKSVPDLWKIITEGNHINERRVTFICKDPVFANGRIIRFDIKIWDQKDQVKNESIPVSSSEADSRINQQKVLREMILPNDKRVKVSVTASNSVGTSGPANLAIPVKGHELPPVEDLKVWPEGGQLWVKWEHSRRGAVLEYVVEWVSGGQIDWQRESKNTNQTVIKGHLEKYVRYNVSVYPVYRRQHGSTWEVGRSTSKEVYLEQGVPLEGPTIRLKGQPGRNEAELEWNEIPQSSRQGFIVNYTIFYTNGTKLHEKTVPANTTSYTLKQLTGNTKYDTWINVSTIRGSARGYNHSFTTLKYAPGEIEGIVVGVSFCFLFVVVLTMLLCVYKRDVIKKNFWPQIPNPGESTIGNWSPDYPVKAETPKENCMSGISVLDVDVCDGKCVFEDDKASLSLKKDKYLSEEHSSGIGGSSCMSSPRQSVSDSDEGGDMAETTASTVQYSSVVASSGYKGQTPSSQPQQAIFSRSESTQPLLDSEENQDMLLQEGSRQSQRFPRQPCFPHTTGNEDSTNQLEMEEREVLEPLDFCPLEEDSEPTMPADSQAADWLPAAPASSYMPQLGGYRPQ